MWSGLVVEVEEWKRGGSWEMNPLKPALMGRREKVTLVVGWCESCLPSELAARVVLFCSGSDEPKAARKGWTVGWCGPGCKVRGVSLLGWVDGGLR